MADDNSEAPPPKRPRLSELSEGQVTEEEEKLVATAESNVEAKQEEPKQNEPSPPHQKDNDDEDSDDDLFGEDDESAEKLGATDSKDDHPSVEQSKAESPIASAPPAAAPSQPEASSSSLPVVAKTESSQEAKPSPKSELNSNTQHQVSVPETAELSIPRKSPSKPPPSSPPKLPSPTASAPSALPPPNDRIPGTVYGLPEGVMVPQTIVRNKLFETEMNAPGSKLMEILKSLPVNLINDALVEYDDAVDIKGTSAIRNHGAYLFGVVKRYVSVHERAMSGEGTGILPMGAGLTPIVEHRLAGLVSSGFCSEQEMNEKVKSKIRMLSEKDALFALDELSSVDRSSIRNFGSYFMGILNRYMRGDVTSKARPRPPQSSSSSNQFGAYGTSNKNNPAPPYNRRPYDGNRPWQPQNNSMMPPGGIPPFPVGGGGPMNPQQQGGFGHNNMSHHPPPNQQQQYMQQHPPQFNPRGAPPPQPYGQQTPAPGYYPSNHNSTNPMHASNPTGAMQGHQQQQMQSSNYQQQHPIMGGAGGGQQQYGNQPPMYQQSYAPQSTTHMMNQQRPPPHQMSQQQPIHQQPPMMVGQQQRSQPPSYGQSWQAPPPPDAATLDIFGLADKAASAIQALGANSKTSFGGSYQQQQQPIQQPMAQPGFTSNQYGATGQQYQPQQQSGAYGQMPFGGGFGQQPTGLPVAKRRTTAEIGDLPGTVQYAVQNLVAMGNLDMLPDEGIMGMIHDLPEELALASLQKFESLDKSQMRNKTAYLAGVLRRELEKINRR